MSSRWLNSPEYLAERDAAIARIVAEAPPPTAAQLVTLRRIFNAGNDRAPRECPPSPDLPAGT